MNQNLRGPDPCAKCLNCGHSRWQHQQMEGPTLSSGNEIVKPGRCLKEKEGKACGCKQYEEPVPKKSKRMT